MKVISSWVGARQEGEVLFLNPRPCVYVRSRNHDQENRWVSFFLSASDRVWEPLGTWIKENIPSPTDDWKFFGFPRWKEISRISDPVPREHWLHYDAAVTHTLRVLVGSLKLWLVDMRKNFSTCSSLSVSHEFTIPVLRGLEDFFSHSLYRNNEPNEPRLGRELKIIVVARGALNTQMFCTVFPRASTINSASC
jgi:hypothetical protein